jgi:hypothetical protein
MSYETNPYFNPEKAGLVKVAEVDMSEPCYSFDLVAVFADDRYLATDSGCSCPTPFESYDGKDDMTGPLSVDQALEEASSLKSAHYEPTYDLDAWNEFIRTVRGYKHEAVSA